MTKIRRCSEMPAYSAFFEKGDGGGSLDIYKTDEEERRMTRRVGRTWRGRGVSLRRYSSMARAAR